MDLAGTAWLHFQQPDKMENAPPRSFSDVAVVTVTTLNYLHRARTLLKSVQEFMPGALPVACCVDPIGARADTASEGFMLLDASSLELPRYSQLVVALNPTALCCALKPHAVKAAFQQPGIKRVLYLDNDMGLYRTPTEILEALDRHSFVLTPHHLAPLAPGWHPAESNLLPYGTFNAGMFALADRPESRGFIDWWGRWLLDPRHLENHWGYDQTWLNYVPVYCPEATILRDPGYNVAFWNLPERDLKRADGGFSCGSHPLTTFHFSHFDETRPSQLVGRGEVSNFAPTPATIGLGEAMAESWNRDGREGCLKWGYGYKSWPDGEPITEGERERVRNLWDEISPDFDLASPRLQTDEPRLFRQIRLHWLMKQERIRSPWRHVVRRLLDLSPRKVIQRLKTAVAGS